MKSEFTFWPKASEAREIAAYSANDVAMIMHDNPDLFTQFLHELWRLDKMEKMFDVVKIAEQTYQMESFQLIQQSAPQAILLMCLHYEVSTDTALKFLKDTFEVVCKASLNFDYQSPLPEELINDYSKSVDVLINSLKPIVRRARAKLN